MGATYSYSFDVSRLIIYSMSCEAPPVAGTYPLEEMVKAVFVNDRHSGHEGRGGDGWRRSGSERVHATRAVVDHNSTQQR